MASECIVAGELGLAYAAICVVDNLANGIGCGAARRRASWKRRASENAARLAEALEAILPELVR